MFSKINFKSLIVFTFLNCFIVVNAIAHPAAIFHNDPPITNYSQDFEGLTANAAPETAGASDLDNDGWKVAGSVYNGIVNEEQDYPGAWEYFYGWFVAPNINTAFVSVATGDDTKDDSGINYLNVFSNYEDTAHADGTQVVESFTARIYTISEDDIGKIFTFSFDAKRPEAQDDGFGGDTSPAVSNGCTTPCTAGAFIKTIDAHDAYATTNYIAEDMSNISQSEWTSYTLTLDLSDPLLVEQALQVGFENRTNNYNNTGVYYDNISISLDDPVSEDEGEFVPFPVLMLMLLSLLLVGTGYSSYRIFK